MKITVTGSLGNISKPLIKELVQKRHAVIVISSKREKQRDIEALGATAAITDEIVTQLKGRKVRYMASEELTCNEVAGILGAAIR